jgi:hypothetical protein
MKRTIAYLLVATSPMFATVPVSFTSGTPAKADDMNRNFASLDSAIQKKADASAVSVLQTAVAAKADLSIKDSLKARVDTGSFTAFKAKEASDIGALSASIATLPTSSNLKSLQDAVATKKDSTWITKNVTPTSIGALPTTGGTITGPTSINHNLNIGGGGVINIGGVGGMYAQFATLRDTVNVGSLKGSANRVIVADANGTLKPGVDASTITTGGPYLPVSGGSMSGYTSYRISKTRSSVLPSLGGVSWGAGGISFVRAPDDDGVVVYGYSSAVSTPFSVVLRGCPSGSACNTPAYSETPIDATSPVLWVDGSGVTHAEALMVAGTKVPDYVFEPDYKLTSLSEVEAYTKEYKHLPEVPSATEIGKSGLDLAQMNLVLLKKVEELTLHAIAQQKEIADLKSSVQELKNR